mmetsp:Transcript_113136/g.344266  ORF Transcript_113136/g.344266 Transcript_113136/m.344266 type:complete len:82 (+) Transcript_113136:18-263(+)
MTFEDYWLNDGVNNSEYMERAVCTFLAPTHHVLMWRGMNGSRNSWSYLAAARRELGKVLCSSPLNCRSDTLHPAFRHVEQD